MRLPALARSQGRSTRTRRHNLLQLPARLLAAAILPLILVACGNNDGEDVTPPVNGEPTPTVADDDSPAATPTPPVDDETPTPAEPPEPPSADNVRFPEAFPDLPLVQRPVDMVEVPGQERFLLVLQEGRVVSFAKDEGAADLVEVLDWRDRTSRAGNEEGLLGIALSPAFEEDGYVYLYYSAQPGERRSAISRFETAGSGEDLRIDPGSELVLLEVPQPFGNHNGGQIAFGPDETLYIALGDGGSGGDPQNHGQRPETLLGSILRIDVRDATADQPYAIPEDNPFVDDPNARDETWAYGLRNPWRMSFDQETGTLWAADVGQADWEEVNIIEGGGNYGWNIMEGFACFIEPNCDQEGLELPVVDYANTGPHCSITGGYVARGDYAGVLEGYYVYGDYCSGAVWAIPADAEPGSESEQITLREGGPQLPSFAQDLDGRIYLLSFSGPIFRVEAD